MLAIGNNKLPTTRQTNRFTGREVPWVLATTKMKESSSPEWIMQTKIQAVGWTHHKGVSGGWVRNSVQHTLAFRYRRGHRCTPCRFVLAPGKACSGWLRVLSLCAVAWRDLASCPGNTLALRSNLWPLEGQRVGWACCDQHDAAVGSV